MHKYLACFFIIICWGSNAIIQAGNAIIQAGVVTSSNSSFQVLDVAPILMDITEYLIQAGRTFDVGLGLMTGLVSQLI